MIDAQKSIPYFVWIKEYPKEERTIQKYLIIQCRVCATLYDPLEFKSCPQCEHKGPEGCSLCLLHEYDPDQYGPCDNAAHELRMHRSAKTPWLHKYYGPIFVHTWCRNCKTTDEVQAMYCSECRDLHDLYHWHDCPFCERKKHAND